MFVSHVRHLWTVLINVAEHHHDRESVLHLVQHVSLTGQVSLVTMSHQD